ncbi:MAG: glycosyl hydrolase 115 family protein [Chitinophagaceae bacterium]
MNKKITLLSLLVICTANLFAQSFITDKKAAGSFIINDPQETSFLYVNATDYNLVQKAANFLQQDIESVTGKKLQVVNTIPVNAKNVVIIGSLDQSPVIKELIAQKKINVDKIKGKWEGYLIQTVANPMKGVANALVIAGSDRRGATYGVFELSRQMGVSPWYWWADVPVKKKTGVYVKANTLITDAPKVKYRGIFINDEAPAFSGWTKEKFGGVNHNVYEKMFELLLRLKANYLWPAMWGNAFNDDDTLNPVLANEYGIVMGTSHHEPMLRAQQEWKRYGKGKWDYDSNEVVLKEFWKKGIQNMRDHESIVTLAMRGDGDRPMTQGTATALLERIVKDQRQIIEDVTKKPASETPQLWALYKEVQDYYDKGMRVPDDVTLLLCDDNWGNVRKLPKLTDKPRKGGYGMYYHFDYVGGPRNYKWLNTNPIPKVWEQMHLAYEYGVRDIWIVNVGDLKPVEFPISFWTDYAWNPERIGPADLQKYTEQWAADQFGAKYAKEIADIVSKYSKYNGRRKPEMIDASTYSLVNYNEWSKVTADYNALYAKAEKLNKEIPAEYKDAYYQLVLHPVNACANLNDMYYYAALNKQAYTNKTANANVYADKVKELYIKDSLITIEYNSLNNGKWNHMMDQKHIGYRSWQEPRVQTMPLVKYVPADSIVKETVTPGATVSVSDNSAKNKIPASIKGNVFYENDGYVSIEGDHFTKAVNGNGVTWRVLPDHGRTGSAVTSAPVTANEQKPGGNSPHLEYDFYTNSNGDFTIQFYFSPLWNFNATPEGTQFAVSIDDAVPQILSFNNDDKANESGINYQWSGDNIAVKNSKHSISQPGKHTVKYWIVNSGIVLQKLVLDFGGVKQSYFGPPETKK